eukprot:TRINITY_DN14212_c0_g1_i4.p1 TRINITY_DN14212_c0_g1~~TRINITY_DN14212_c0_g1_i4.p1  ORF type:complete len:262 (+),score=-30.01 TRINITY_DN14212_c0_g1_i4:90-788(+)
MTCISQITYQLARQIKPILHVMIIMSLLRYTRVTIYRQLLINKYELICGYKHLERDQGKYYFLVHDRYLQNSLHKKLKVLYPKFVIQQVTQVVPGHTTTIITSKNFSLRLNMCSLSMLNQHSTLCCLQSAQQKICLVEGVTAAYSDLLLNINQYYYYYKYKIYIYLTLGTLHLVYTYIKCKNINSTNSFIYSTYPNTQCIIPNVLQKQMRVLNRSTACKYTSCIVRCNFYGD